MWLEPEAGEVHARLVARLGVRDVQGPASMRESTARGRGKPHKEPVLVDGRRYESIRAAARALGTSASTIFGRLERGKASYL